MLNTKNAVSLYSTLRHFHKNIFGRLIVSILFYKAYAMKRLNRMTIHLSFVKTPSLFETIHFVKDVFHHKNV